MNDYLIVFKHETDPLLLPTMKDQAVFVTAVSFEEACKKLKIWVPSAYSFECKEVVPPKEPKKTKKAKNENKGKSKDEVKVEEVHGDAF